MPDVFTRVQSVLARQLGHEPERVSPPARLHDDLMADSLDCIEIAMAVEDEFGVEISDSAAGRMVTVADVQAAVEAALARGGRRRG